MQPKSRLKMTVFAFAVGGLLASGFVASSLSLGTKLGLTGPVGEWAQSLCFVALAFLFCLSLPAPTLKGGHTKMALKSIPLAVLIALIYGYVIDQQSFQSFAQYDSKDMVWYWLAAPIGEEFLFRGWAYRLSERIWPKMFFTATNPLPTAVWFSSILFSLWHVQNYPSLGLGLTFFTVFYTLFVGLWLGYIYWKSGSLWICMTAHCLINFGANVL